MDYNKLNTATLDGNNNILLQDIEGSTITINQNDTEALHQLFEKLSNEQAFRIKELIGNQNKALVEEIRKLQERFDEQFIEKQATEVTNDLDEFFRDLKQMKIDGIKKNLMTNYQLLREYEELLVFEQDPMKKMSHNHHIEDIKKKIEAKEKELRTV